MNVVEPVDEDGALQPAGERWLPIVGYEGRYEVSDQGRVRSLTRQARVLKLLKGRAEYPAVNLHSGGVQRTRIVHQLVLEAFVGPRPEGYVTRHLNGSRQDNRLCNLAWGTVSENALDDVRNGVHPTQSKTHCPQKHEYTPENTKVHKKTGHRHCRECARISARQRYERICRERAA